MDFKMIICGYVLISSLLTAPLVYSENPNSSISGSAEDSQKKREWWENKVQDVYNQLNLSDEQKMLLEENKKNGRERKKALYEKRRLQKEALNQELMKPQLNLSKINEIQSEIKSLQSQISDDRLNSILEVRRILTREQFIKFISLTSMHTHDDSSAEGKWK